MSRAAAATAASALAGALLLLPACRSERPPVEGAAATTRSAPGPSSAVDLYFPGRGGYLVAERHEIAAAEEPRQRIATLVRALLAGPREDGLLPPFPISAESPVELLGVHLSASGIAFVDLGSAELAAPPLAGSRGELLTVYGLVNSILLNVPEARAVVLLWNGRQRPSFGGHLDTTRPLTASSDWVAAST